jgi:catechol 2,3-dioxygenase-like lactoylglutathione lyase family enzyme
MFRILQLDHLVLRVRDLGAMLRFYIDVLGCTAMDHRSTCPIPKATW